MSKPFVLIISGVAGSGKDSLIEELWRHPDLFEIAVSYTDRPIRPGEVDGKNYHYITSSEFDSGIAKGEFIEWEKVRGSYRYGRKKADLKKAFKNGKTVVMSAEPLGFIKFKKMYDVASVFITPPSLEEAIIRLKKRGNDTHEGLKNRIDRYALELSYKDKYDHIIINDDLEQARKELLLIATQEKDKRRQKKVVKKTLFGLALIFLLSGSTFISGYYSHLKKNNNSNVAFPPGLSGNVNSDNTNPTQITVAPSPLPSAEVKKKIAAAPPKKPTAEKIATSTAQNSDGSTTTTVSTGGTISQSDLATLNSQTGTADTPLSISYIDNTGKYSALGDILKNYLNSTLKWRTEVSAMKGILVENAGNSGWNGQYLGRYTVLNSGKVTNASGSIVINTYYIENQYCAGAHNFDGCSNEYAKLFLSHEYGHHYTLYHKWLDWNNPSGTRFPDSYYNVRPLSKTTTATDYSLGWSNCEVEIIAEDYSYLYSGYGLQAMHSTFGYPSAATKTWLDNIGAESQLNVVENAPPAVAITAPADGAVISGSVDFTADADDDVGVSSVSFYIGDKLIEADSAPPYATTLNTTAYQNGTYILKTVATDGTTSIEKTVSVTFNNSQIDTTNPTISMTVPSANPYTMTSDNLDVSVLAADNVAIDRIELYFDDQFQQNWKTASLDLSVSFKNLSAGTYILKFKIYDTAGNSAEATLTVNKQ
ncbi:MAG TPA: Ig-like domain-containing protein [Patescibacteria group bacterium]|nr:Ig-like domain-containing protein [Patescibacteria group bacterium]